ncbi:class I SAM-dependent methyltransferase [Chloroflexota bacterium]
MRKGEALLASDFKEFDTEGNVDSGCAVQNKESKFYRWFYKRIFSRWYDSGVRFFLGHFGGEDGFRQELLRTIFFSSDDRILDLCYGTGGVTQSIIKRAGTLTRIIGVDRSVVQITNAIKKNTASNVSFVLSCASATGLLSGYFDKVFIGHALHEMPRRIRLAVINEAKRIIRNEGQVIIFEFNKPSSLKRRLWLGFWLLSWIPYPINFEKRTIQDMLEHGVDDEVRECGFRNVHKIIKFNGTMQIVTANK